MFGIENVLYQLLIWVITAIVGWLVGRLTSMAKRENQKMDALMDGVRSLLRNELVKTHKECVVKNAGCTLVDKEVTERNYRAYHALGGNGTGTALYDEIMSLPIIDE